MNNPLTDGMASTYAQRQQEIVDAELRIANEELRQAALQFSVLIHCDGRDPPDETVLATAKQYYKFLKGEIK